MSPMITGPSNFPTARNEKALNTERKRFEELTAWEKKALNAIKRKLKDTGPKEDNTAQEVKKLKTWVDRTVNTLKDIEEGKAKGYDPNVFQKQSCRGNKKKR